MARRWPLPLEGRTFHVIGDMHVGATAQHRLDKAFYDMVSGSVLPPVVGSIQVGDVVDDGLASEDTVAAALFAQLPWPWLNAQGEHDVWNGVRTDAQWAAAWGRPGRVYAQDLSDLVTVVTCPPGPTTGELSAIATLATAAVLPVVLVAHRPIKGSIGSPSSTFGNQPDTNAAGVYTTPNIEYRAMLDSTPAIKLIVCGHTHNAMDAPNLMARQNVGSRDIAQINAGALAYTNVSKGSMSDPLPSLYVTWLSSSVEIRVREHGSGVWLAPAGQKLTTLSLL